MIKMTYTIFYFLGLLQIQLIKSQNRFCPEAVSSMRIVTTCPTSKTEWDSAALKMNCGELAQRQNCVSFNKFKYHCVINGLRNKLVEVCAPERIIFGYCVEFNVRGGVIQDQNSAFCNRRFPKCDRFYYSTNAYKYPDCYMLVSKDEAIWLTTKDISAKLTTMRTITDESLSLPTSIAIIAAILIVGIIASLVILSLKIRKSRMRSGMRVDESKEAMLEDINIQHDNADDDEMVEKEDDEEMVEKDDDEEMVEKEDDEEMVEKEDELNNADDDEMVEKEDDEEMVEKEDDEEMVEKKDELKINACTVKEDDEEMVEKKEELNNADDDEMVEKEDDEEIVEKDDDEEMVEKEDDEEMVEQKDELKINACTVKEDDEEMVEKKDELRIKKMERYGLKELQSALRTVLGNGLTEDNVQSVKDVMSRYKSDPQDWKEKEKWSDVKFTRTLLDKGNGHYNLMILCWNVGQESPIHNHPDSHCFMKTLEGVVHEELYKKPDVTSCRSCGCKMEKIGDRDYAVNNVALITDKDGVHRVGNRSHVDRAVTLHLYSPPFTTCHKYDDDTSKETEVPMGFDQDFSGRCCGTSCCS